MEHLHHMTVYDGVLHWCFWIAVGGFVVGMLWVMLRVLMPLMALARMAESIMAGSDLPKFDLPVGGIPEIDRLRVALRRMNEQVRVGQARERMYRAALTDIQESERTRIARDIHDDTIQALVLVTHTVERVTALIEREPQAALRPLHGLREQVVGIINDLRRMIANLRPNVLDELGLAVALAALREQHPKVEVEVIGQPYAIDQGHELAVLRAAQEGVRNAERHAHAQHIRVRLDYGIGEVTLCVSDDGRGFSLPERLQDFAVRGHFGLMGIWERVSVLGGRFSLHSQPGTGTRLTLNLPVVL